MPPKNPKAVNDLARTCQVGGRRGTVQDAAAITKAMQGDDDVSPNSVCKQLDSYDA